MEASGYFGVDQVGWELCRRQAPSPLSVLYPAPPRPSLPSPSVAGQATAAGPSMMEPAGRCGTLRLAAAAGEAPSVDSSGSSRKVGWRKVGRRARHWWGRLQGFGAGWRPLSGLPTHPGHAQHCSASSHAASAPASYFPVPRPGSGDRKHPWSLKHQWPLAFLVCTGKIGWLDLLH